MIDEIKTASEPPLDWRVGRLTKPQRRALEFVDSDGELQIGGADGRSVRLDVAERLVDMGVLVRTHVPLPDQRWYGYRRAMTSNVQS